MSARFENTKIQIKKHIIVINELLDDDDDDTPIGQTAIIFCTKPQRHFTLTQLDRRLFKKYKNLRNFNIQ